MAVSICKEIWTHGCHAGKYLGGHQEFNRAVLTEFVRCHEFSQLLLVQALRQFLWSFR
jgi:cytohesin